MDVAPTYIASYTQHVVLANKNVGCGRGGLEETDGLAEGGGLGGIACLLPGQSNLLRYSKHILCVAPRQHQEGHLPTHLHITRFVAFRNLDDLEVIRYHVATAATAVGLYRNVRGCYLYTITHFLRLQKE